MEAAMNSSAIILIIAIPAIYGVILVGLAVLVRPLRYQIVDIGEAILADPNVREAGRERVNRLLDTCMSFRVGLLIPVAAIGVIIDDILRRDQPQTPLQTDYRFHELLWRYFVSILAANPVMALVTVPLIIVCSIAHQLLRGDDGLRGAVEEPVIRASGAVRIREPELVA
jgi:hypothetical protein